MKRLIPVLIILLLTGTGLYFYHTHKKENSPLNTAQNAERVGNIQLAYQAYSEAMLSASPACQLPDINVSKVVSPDYWRKDLEKYIEWVCVPSQAPATFYQLLDALRRCKDSTVQAENKLVNMKVKPISKDNYISEWKNAFYASTAPADSSQTALASGNHFRKISLIKLSSEKSYTYELNLISLASGKRTSFTLYPENSVTVLASSGEYLLVCRSTVQFSANQVWRSSYAVIPITVPKEAVMITGMMISKIAREKK